MTAASTWCSRMHQAPVHSLERPPPRPPMASPRSVAFPSLIQVTSRSRSRAAGATQATIGTIDVTGPTGSSPINPRAAAPAAPVVLSEQLVFAGKGKHRYVAGVLLTFSSALDPATAGNSSNYSVVQTSKVVGRAKAIKPVRLHVAYKAAAHAVKLTFSGKPRFTAGGQLVLIASGATGIASSSGVPLDGNTGNQPGADAVYTILPRARGISA